MTKIIYKTGDLLESEEQIIVHQVNAQGVMASGIAKAIREKYPEVYDDYKRHEQENGLELADVIITECYDGRYVFSIVGQKNYGRDGIQYTSNDALGHAFIKINKAFQERFETTGVKLRFGMPKIGCGLGGGDWKLISRILEMVSDNFQPVVYTL